MSVTNERDMLRSVVPSFRKPRKLGQPLLWWGTLGLKVGQPADDVRATFDQAKAMALQLLKNPKCGDAYGGRGPAKIGATNYHFVDANFFARRGYSVPWQMAVWPNNSNVYVNLQSPGLSSSDGSVQITIPGTNITLSGGYMLGAFDILHELAHQLKGITGAADDYNSPIAETRNNNWVFDKCFAP